MNYLVGGVVSRCLVAGESQIKQRLLIALRGRWLLHGAGPPTPSPSGVADVSPDNQDIGQRHTIFVPLPHSVPEARDELENPRATCGLVGCCCTVPIPIVLVYD